MLGQRLSKVKNNLIQFGYDSEGTRTTAIYLHSIRKFYELESGHIEVDTKINLGERDKKNYT